MPFMEVHVILVKATLIFLVMNTFPYVLELKRHRYYVITIPRVLGHHQDWKVGDML